MKTMITTLLLLTSTAFAGGGGSAPIETFAKCQSPDGDKVSILFKDGTGYYLSAEMPISAQATRVNAVGWNTTPKGFYIDFIDSHFRGKFTSQSPAFKSSQLDQVGELYALSDKFAYVRLACLHR